MWPYTRYQRIREGRIIWLLILIIFELIVALYLLLLHCERLVVKRLNEFYIVIYTFPHPLVCLKMNRGLRRELRKGHLTIEQVQLKINRCTSLLCKNVPSGTYSALTHDRVLEGLRHMERRGRATIIKCKPKGRPKKQKREYRHLFGCRYSCKELPKLQMYRIHFIIH